MGTIAEKLRSGGMGVPAFYSPVGVGTMIEDGGIPSKLHKGGKSVEQVSDAKEKRQFHEQDFLLERTIQSDFSFVKAWKADHKGNCIFKKCGINFNPDVGSAGKICIVEADEIVDTGVIDGEDVEFGGIFVHRVVKSESHPTPLFKQIKESELLGTGEIKNKRLKIVKRAAQEIRDGMYVHLANGYAATLKDYLRKDIQVDLFTESGVFCYEKDMKNADINLLDGNMNFISLKKGASITKASDSFSALRGSHLSLIVAEGYQVSQNGDLANWSKKNELLSPKALFDATSANTPLVVMMEHVNAEGRSNIVKECTYNLTGTKCVSKIITDMAVFEFKDDELVLTEISPDVTMEDVKRATEAKFRVEKCYSKINLH
jgi:3-oxoacid CoA-transferase